MMMIRKAFMKIIQRNVVTLVFIALLLSQTQANLANRLLRETIRASMSSTRRRLPEDDIPEMSKAQQQEQIRRRAEEKKRMQPLTIPEGRRKKMSAAEAAHNMTLELIKKVAKDTFDITSGAMCWVKSRKTYIWYDLFQLTIKNIKSWDCRCRDRDFDDPNCPRSAFSKAFNYFFRHSGPNTALWVVDTRVTNLIRRFLQSCGIQEYQCYEAVTSILMPMCQDIKILRPVQTARGQVDVVNVLSKEVPATGPMSLFKSSEFLEHFVRLHCFDKIKKEDLQKMAQQTKETIIAGSLIPIYEILTLYETVNPAEWHEPFLKAITSIVGANRLAAIVQKAKNNLSSESYKAISDELINLLVPKETVNIGSPSPVKRPPSPLAATARRN